MFTMKTIVILLLTIIVFAGCKQNAADNKTMMQMDSDSVYTKDKNATVVKANDTLRISESMKNFEDNPNITKTDIDAGSRLPSPEVRYVKQGDTIKIAEPGIKIK